MPGANLKLRTKAFSLGVVQFVRDLPSEDAVRLMGRQLLRAGTSVGANYRSACRARSRSDMIAKLKIVEEEVDECGFWFELLEESGLQHPRLRPLLQESYELLAITVTSIKTLRRKSSG